MDKERPLLRKGPESATEGSKELQEFFDRYEQQAVPQGTELVREGFPLKDVFFLDEGGVMMYKTRENGREFAFDLGLPGDFLFAGSLGGETQTPCGIRTVLPSSVRKIPLRHLQAALEASPQLASEMFEHMKRISIRKRKLEAVLNETLLGKVANLILLLSQENTGGPDNTVRMPNNVYLEKLLLSGQKKLSVAFSDLRRAGIISYSIKGSRGERRVTIEDTDRLKKIAQGGTI